ncbi:MAG: hypothetical protein MR562_08600, partial [Clostridiaceae bacterium]|nr:hypothetical protein [Clostridiaceae bacterium]
MIQKRLFSFFIILFYDTVQQDIQLTLTSFFMFLQKFIQGEFFPAIGAETHIKKIHIRAEIFHDEADGEPSAQIFPFQKPGQDRDCKSIKGLAECCDFFIQAGRRIEGRISKDSKILGMFCEEPQSCAEIALQFFLCRAGQCSSSLA